MIGESAGDLASTIVAGGPLTDSDTQIVVTIPENFTGSLVYFCTDHHTTMSQDFQIARLYGGKLAFWSNEKLVMSYHRGGGLVQSEWRRTRDVDGALDAPADKDGWRTYAEPAAETLLQEVLVDEVLWTKDTRLNNELTLPDGRVITRRFIEYVSTGDYAGRINSPNFNFSNPKGFTGMKLVPHGNRWECTCLCTHVRGC